MCDVWRMAVRGPEQTMGFFFDVVLQRGNDDIRFSVPLFAIRETPEVPVDRQLEWRARRALVEMNLDGDIVMVNDV